MAAGLKAQLAETCLSKITFSCYYIHDDRQAVGPPKRPAAGRLNRGSSRALLIVGKPTAVTLFMSVVTVTVTVT